MIMKVFSVFDAKLATFGRPWFQMTDAAALREFSDAVNDGSNPNNQWHTHPEDFSLFVIGEFDDQSGELIPRTPLSLVTASSLVVNFSRSKPEQLDLGLLPANQKNKEPVH